MTCSACDPAPLIAIDGIAQTVVDAIEVRIGSGDWIPIICVVETKRTAPPKEHKEHAELETK